MTFKHLVALLVSVCMACAAQSTSYQSVQAEKSSINFRYKQMGVTVDGKFRKFQSTLQFDPAKPELARASIEVDLASVDTGSAEGDEEVLGKPWFHTTAFPKALFVLKQMKPTGPDTYEASGTLSIKGHPRDLKFAVKHIAQGGKGQLSASFNLARSDFSIGEGVWSKFDVIANDIQVNFQLAVQSGK